MILNDTFMLGRDCDGSASLFNLVAEARGKDASDASWVSASDIDAWLPEYSLLGSDLGGLTEETPLDGSSGTRLLGRTWWWWPHCVMRSYLIVCHILEPLRESPAMGVSTRSNEAVSPNTAYSQKD